MQVGPELFNAVFLVSPRTGKPVPLSSLVKVDMTRTRSLSIAHQGQFPAATISFNLAPGVSLGTATELVARARRSSGRHLAAGLVPGQCPGFPGIPPDEPLLILAAVLAVYVILGVLYESYVHPAHDPLYPTVGGPGVRCWRCASPVTTWT